MVNMLGHRPWPGIDDETCLKSFRFQVESLVFLYLDSLCRRSVDMSLIELFLIAVGLSMDAFAVAICKGLATSRVKFSNMVVTGLWFGLFQALMPLLGYMLGVNFSSIIQSVDHWIAFVLLSLIGLNMIREAVSSDDDDEGNCSYAPSVMFPLAIATSIDALAVGVSFAFLAVDIVPAVLFIGVCTLTLSCAGVKMGAVFGDRFKSKAEIAGGVILMLMGLKILLEHLGVVSF